MFIPDLTHIRRRTRGYLPHWERNGATYFVTYRLADSLPRHVVARLQDDDLETALDAGHGASHLRDPRIANLVISNWQYSEGTRYELIAWCVMPNHVHLVLTPTTALATIVRTWKTYTAKHANAILGRTGPFWCREYFDRLIRGEEELDRLVAYVVGNPLKAGLQDWPWVWSRGDSAF